MGFKIWIFIDFERKYIRWFRYMPLWTNLFIIFFPFEKGFFLIWLWRSSCFKTHNSTNSPKKIVKLKVKICKTQHHLSLLPTSILKVIVDNLKQNFFNIGPEKFGYLSKEFFYVRLDHWIKLFQFQAGYLHIIESNE